MSTKEIQDRVRQSPSSIVWTSSDDSDEAKCYSGSRPFALYLNPKPFFCDKRLLSVSLCVCERVGGRDGEEGGWERVGEGGEGEGGVGGRVGACVAD